jgi:hypothetical protein
MVDKIADKIIIFVCVCLVPVYKNNDFIYDCTYCFSINTVLNLWNSINIICINNAVTPV